MKVSSFLTYSAFLWSVFFSAATLPAHAISENDYEAIFQAKVIPFLRAGTTFTFCGYDGLPLSAVKFIHEKNSKGTLLIVQGRSESWVKDAEIFYDLYQLGYDIYAYDHRGQGLSPHLSSKNTQIGHVGYFNEYTFDLNLFVENILKPIQKADPKNKLFIMGHSMGGAITADYLSLHESPFAAAILSAPMLQINTKPYPEVIAQALAGTLTLAHLGNAYAPGRGDLDPNLPFEKNDTTHSKVRYEMTQKINALYPTSVIGGPSNQWVYTSLAATHRIRKHMKQLKTPTLLFQAGKDQIVKPHGQKVGCGNSSSCKIVPFAESGHEIFVEVDSVRNRAIQMLDAFFTAH